jgi:hypothetical protein
MLQRKSRDTKFTIIVIVIIGTAAFLGVLVIGCSTLPVVAPIERQLHDLECRNNLKAFDSALALYRNDYNQQFPPYSGVKFIAVLYRTGYLVEKKYFLCPAKEGDDWVETGPNRTSWKFEKPAPREEYSKNWNPKFEPWEISYAGRRNDPKDEGGKFHLSTTGPDPTPIISDSTLNHKGENDAKYAPHNGAVNVLLTNGSIIKLKGVAVGQKAPSGNTTDMDLESLQND